MPFREYEAKVFVEEEQALSQKFGELGAELLHLILQDDSYYDLNFRLSKKDELLRIRAERTLESQQFIRGEFSWKSGRQGEQYEVREDISSPIFSEKSVVFLQTILDRLGFRKVAWLSKERERWKLRDVEFEFDKFIQVQAINRPKIQIGSYLQATIETEHEFTPPKMEQLLWNSLEELGFNRTQLCWKSYIELYIAQLNEFSPSSTFSKRDL
ncbi:MAG: CYTH domain-containing protein [Promethearchaeota archaeon]|nr:MAG: CYTH domain-containing protein [Candidatus Lokiarchaeota archaeon]